MGNKASRAGNKVSQVNRHRAKPAARQAKAVGSSLGNNLGNNPPNSPATRPLTLVNKPRSKRWIACVRRMKT